MYKRPSGARIVNLSHLRVNRSRLSAKTGNFQELHNNHRAFTGSAKFFLQPWEFDIVSPIAV
jgi:hypothetical protein